MQVGISEHDLVRGTVVGAGPVELTIRIVSGGRFPHYVNGTEVKPGAVVSDLPTNWVPCT